MAQNLNKSNHAARQQAARNQPFADLAKLMLFAGVTTTGTPVASQMAAVARAGKK